MHNGKPLFQVLELQEVFVTPKNIDAMNKEGTNNFYSSISID